MGKRPASVSALAAATVAVVFLAWVVGESGLVGATVCDDVGVESVDLGASVRRRSSPQTVFEDVIASPDVSDPIYAARDGEGRLHVAWTDDDGDVHVSRLTGDGYAMIEDAVVAGESARGLAVDTASGDVGLLVHRLLGSVCGCSAGDCPGPCGQMLFVLFEGGDLTAESLNREIDDRVFDFNSGSAGLAHGPEAADAKSWAAYFRVRAPGQSTDTDPRMCPAGGVDVGDDGDSLRVFEADALPAIFDRNEAVASPGFCWGACEPSIDGRVAYSDALGVFATVCLTNDASGPGIFFNRIRSVYPLTGTFDAKKVSAALGDLIAVDQGWALTFVAPRPGNTLADGETDLAFVTISSSGTVGDVVWLTNTVDVRESRPKLVRLSDTRLLVGWADSEERTWLRELNEDGSPAEAACNLAGKAFFSATDNFVAFGDRDVAWVSTWTAGEADGAYTTPSSTVRVMRTRDTSSGGLNGSGSAGEDGVDTVVVVGLIIAGLLCIGVVAIMVACQVYTSKQKKKDRRDGNGKDNGADGSSSSQYYASYASNSYNEYAFYSASGLVSGSDGSGSYSCGSSGYNGSFGY